VEVEAEDRIKEGNVILGTLKLGNWLLIRMSNLGASGSKLYFNW